MQGAKNSANIKSYGYGTPQRCEDWAAANSDRHLRTRQDHIAGSISQWDLDQTLKA